MAEENVNQSLIDAFRSFPPGHIYTLGPKRSAVHGFVLYRKEGVKALAWRREGSELAVSFGDNRSQEVRFLLKGDHLSSLCACGGSSDQTPCHHIICALMTIKNLLNPDLFRQPHEDKKRREALLASLLRDDKSSSLLGPLHADLHTHGASQDVQFAIFIEKKGNKAHISVMKNGKKVGLNDPTFRLPPELYSISNPYDLEDTKEKRLLKFLRKDGNAYPIIFRNGNTETAVRWNGSLEVNAVTELNASGSTIHISKRFHRVHGSCLLSLQVVSFSI